jgi:plasmid maintenance system killer protein
LLDPRPTNHDPRITNYAARARIRGSISASFIPPANRLELLKGDRAGQWSVRVNDQFRICFCWTGADSENVEIVDYH